MTAPVGDISLGDLQGLTTLLLGCGASIDEINTLRKHLDQVKGGKLARLAAPAQVITLILSDVVGDPLDVIASGPTVPDPTTFAVAWGILDRYNLLERTPTSILAYLRRGLLGEVPETPKGGDSVFMGVQNVVVGNNRLAARAALAEAEALGFHSLLLTTYLQGEARQAGRFLAAIARQLASDAPPLPRPACIVCGGETTVTLSGDGQGGRNQEVALGAVAEMAGLNDIALVTLATDGGDGPTDAAGAVVTGETLFRASARGLLPADFLARNDSYHFFAALEDLFKTGPTQTNVNDLALVFAF
jgi:hydroxypyruvate reductase